MPIELEKIIQSIAISVNSAQKKISDNDSFLVEMEESDISFTFNGTVDEDSLQSGKGLVFSSLEKNKQLKKGDELKETSSNSSSMTVKFLFTRK